MSAATLTRSGPGLSPVASHAGSDSDSDTDEAMATRSRIARPNLSGTSAILVIALVITVATAACSSSSGDRNTPVALTADPDRVVPRGYLCGRASAPLVIDGNLDEADWSTAPWTADFADIEGPSKPIPFLRTRAKMLWDDEYFYLGAWLEEPDVWAYQTQHDSVIFHDNDFEVFLDPDGDRHQYTEIEINARGTVWDLRLVRPYTDGGPAVDSFEVHGLKSAVTVDGTLNRPDDIDRSWSVELAIPWSALAEFCEVPCPPRPGDQWRLGLSRVEWRTQVEEGHTVKVPHTAENNWTWTPQFAVDMHQPEHWGFVQFCESRAAEATFFLDPSQPARVILCRVHAAQRAYWEAHGEYAPSLELLHLNLAPNYSAAIRIEVLDGGYEARLATLDRDGNTSVLQIRHDGRLQLERVRL